MRLKRYAEEQLIDNDPNWPDTHMERALEYLRKTCVVTWKARRRRLSGRLRHRLRLVHFRNETLRRFLGPFVARIGLARRQFHLDRRQVGIGDLLQQMRDAI